MEKSHGKHLILDLILEKPVFPNEMMVILNRLPDRIGMIKLCKPRVYKAVDYPYGWTGGVYITTSHIKMHSYEYRNGESRLAFDLYSCKNFSVIKVLKTIREFIGKFKFKQKLIIKRYA